MYIKRLQIANYGSIRDLDITFPFDGSRPKPVLLVGENGSGKTIALSHIVNAMVWAKDGVFQESRELDPGKVFKLRSGSYVSVGTEYYYVRSDFETGHFIRELRLTKPKHEYAQPPMGVDGRGLDAWNARFESEEIDHLDSNIIKPLLNEAEELVSARCLLYFSSNRLEEPAWLNQDDLRAKPQNSEGIRRKGMTRRTLIARSPLRDIHDWLYDVAYDRAVFELLSQSLPIAISSTQDESNSRTLSVPMPVILGYQGEATIAYELVLNILRIVLPDLATKANLQFGIGGRHNRTIALQSDEGVMVPNLFHLFSGEMALLSLFFSILRDFDLREARHVSFSSAQDVKGLVVVDEADLYLHS